MTHRGAAYDIAEKLELINAAALVACDADDGADKAFGFDHRRKGRSNARRKQARQNLAALTTS